MDVEILIECDSCNKEVNIQDYDEVLDLCNLCKCCNSLEKLNICSDLLILSIDIGIKHLALVLSSVTNCYDFKEILWVNLIDITIFDCKSDCKLHHDKTFADWMLHVMERYNEIFNKANFILIERQPLNGFVAVEQIIFGYWREKSILISPNSVHKFFNMNCYDYDGRKNMSINISSRYVCPEIQKEINKYERKHDICDAILFTIFWIKKQKEKMEIEILVQKQKEAMEKFNSHIKMSLNDFFDMYRYIPSQQCI